MARSADGPARRSTDPPPLGSDPAEIVAFLHHERTRWAQIRRPYLRQVEENVRNLAGYQYDAYIPELQEFVNLAQFFVPSDERWRRFPVVNWLTQRFFLQAIAKLTENPPVLGAMPATSDQRDAETAQIVDPWLKYQWHRMGMAEKLYGSYGWLLTAGAFWHKYWWDPNAGPSETWTADAVLTVLGETRVYTDAPYVIGPDGQPTPHVLTDESGQMALDGNGQPQFGDPHRQPLGDLNCSVIPPTSIVTPYGPEAPWEKPWLQHEYYLTPETVWERFQVDCEGETEFSGPDDGYDDLLRRMEYTSYYGNPANPEANIGLFFGTGQPEPTEGMVRVIERWIRACPQYPQGRLMICAGQQQAQDDINPYVTPQRSKVVVPFHYFPKPGLPFRQEGHMDLENLIPVARAKNRAFGGMLDASALNEQPIRLVNINAVSDDQDDKLNQPGGIVYHNGTAPDPVRYLTPPALPQHLKDMDSLLTEELEGMGGISAPPSAPVSSDPSGELLREQRFDADRPWGATLRYHGEEWARAGQTMLDIAAVCQSDERFITIAGEDQIARFLTVRPEMFEGQVHVRCSPESAVLETRQDKQNRLLNLFVTMSKLPPPLAQSLAKTLNVPDIQRAILPNAQAWSTAQQNLAWMWQTGQVAPVLPEQDHQTFIQTVTEWQQRPEWQTATPQQQQALRNYVTLHKLQMADQALQNAALVEHTQSAIQATQQAAQMAGGRGPGGPMAPGPQGPPPGPANAPPVGPQGPLPLPPQTLPAPTPGINGPLM